MNINDIVDSLGNIPELDTLAIKDTAHSCHADIKIPAKFFSALWYYVDIAHERNNKIWRKFLEIVDKFYNKEDISGSLKDIKYFINKSGPDKELKSALYTLKYIIENTKDFETEYKYSLTDDLEQVQDNSLLIQIQNNSSRLTAILNSRKGNPYHDKEGKFCSGPGKAFGMFARSSEFRHIEEPTVKSAAKNIFPTSGPNDVVMTSMTDEQIIATYECKVATIGVENFNRNAKVTHDKEAPKELLSLNDRISNDAQMIYEEIGKFTRGTGREKDIKESKLKSALNIIEKMTNDSQKCANLASKMKVPESENYAKRLVVEGNDALQAVRATLSYISKNTEDKVRYFETK